MAITKYLNNKLNIDVFPLPLDPTIAVLQNYIWNDRKLQQDDYYKNNTN